MKSTDTYLQKTIKALKPVQTLRFFAFTFLIAMIAHPCLASDGVCIELVYADTISGDAVITVRDYTGSATVTTVGGALHVAVLDSITLVDFESDLSITQLDGTTFMATVPFVAGTVPGTEDGELGTACTNTVRATYSPGPAFTAESAVSYVCDGIDVIACDGARIIDQREINLTANSFVLNAELMMVQGMFEEADTTSVLRFGTTSTDTGWTTTLIGSFLGEDLVVTYTGTVDDQSSPDHVFLSYVSTGTYGTGDWTGSGVLCWDEDPVSGAPLQVTGQLYSDNCDLPDKAPFQLELSIELSVPIGWVVISGGLTKNFGTNTLSASLGAGDSAGFASVGGRMDLDQGTGANQAYVEGEAVWGWVSAEYAIGDATQAFSTSGGAGGEPLPPDPPPCYPYDGPSEWLRCLRPPLPDDAIAGTNNLDWGVPLHDIGYIGGYPFQDGIAHTPDTTIPEAYKLHANYPNPFNPTTTIHYELPETGMVRIRVYDVAGRLVRVLVDGVAQDAGPHSTVWDGRDRAGRQVSSGIYFYRFESRGFEQTNRMVLVK